MNHMEEVAHMLDLELYENFRFKSRLIDLSTYEFKFTEDYLMYYHTEGDYWNKASFDTLCNLLNGKYEVIKLPKSILTKQERCYLSSVVKPFREKILHISFWLRLCFLFSFLLTFELESLQHFSYR